MHNYIYIYIYYVVLYKESIREIVDSTYINII